MKKYYIINSIVLTTILFLGFLSQFIFQNSSNIIFENRNKKPCPKLTKIRLYPKELDEWFSDNFVGRESLIKFNGWINFFILKTSPSPKVIIGSNNFLYLNDGNILENYTNAYPFSEKELNQITTNLQNISQTLAKHNIQYVLLIAPDQYTIVPENLPSWIKKINPKSRLDQLLEKTKALNIIDIRTRLIELKQELQPYYKTDTHWNPWGAYVGYEALMFKLQELLPNYYSQLTPLDIGKFSIIKSASAHYGDLANMTGIPSYFPENIYDIKIFQEVKALNATDFQITNRNISHKITTIMFRDSFGSALIPYLGPHFNKIDAYWTAKLDLELIIKRKPLIVIQEITERVLILLTL